MTPASSDPLIGASVAHYRIVDKIGEGGMGAVYKAEDTRLERSVALKFLRVNELSDNERRRFQDEARTAARVHHPNICPIYEIGEEEGKVFFAMAYIEGRSLSRLCAAGPLPVSEALGFAIQVAEGLHAAHEHGVVHRDIKPGNIAVSPAGAACILDFGIALRPGSDRVTHAGAVVGTPAYMSPEQAMGAAVDRRSDLWSLGVVLFEMIAGELPFEGPNHMALLHAIVGAPPKPLSDEFPRSVDALLRRALDKDPGKRWQTAEEMATQMKLIRASQSVRSTETLAAAPLVTPRGRLGRAPRAALLTAILLAGSLVTYRVWPRGAALPEEKHIAVLPSAIAGNDDAVRGLADGLTEIISSKLMQIEDFQGKLMVVPPSELRSRKISSAEAARRTYGANLVITVSAQKVGNFLDFTLNLVDTSPVRVIASRSLRFDSANPIAMRDAVVNDVIRLLALRLLPEAASAVRAGETSAQEAYRNYLKGAGYLARFDTAGNIERAVTSLSRATEEDPNYALAFAALGDAYWAQATQLRADKGAVAKAMESIERAIRIDPRLPDAYVSLAKIYVATGRSAEAMAKLRESLKIAPSNAAAYRELGVASDSLGQFTEAERYFRLALARRPSDWAGYLMLGNFLRERGRDNEARRQFEQARRLTPDNEVVHRSLAILDMRRGNFREASDLLSQAVRFEPLSRTYSSLGIALYCQKRYSEAVNALLTAVNLNPEHHTFWGNLGSVYRHMPGEETKARDSFAKAIALTLQDVEIAPAVWDHRADLAEYYAKTGEARKALEQIDAIPEPARPPLADPIAVAYEVMGRRSKAVEVIRALPSGDPVLTYMKYDPDLEALWAAMKAP